MMQYASSGVRATVRKATNALVHGGHNGPGHSSSKPLNVVHNLQTSLHPTHTPSVYHRNPGHHLFSASKNLLQTFFGHLTAPGLRAPVFSAQGAGYGARSLHGTAIRGPTIQQGLSLSTRQGLHNHALRRQANMFLPRAPAPAPPRFGGVAQVGLGAARNFSSARPIFEQLAHNVPIALRALYEVDMGLTTGKGKNNAHFAISKDGKQSNKKPAALMKPVKATRKPRAAAIERQAAVVDDQSEEIEHFFAAEVIAPVTTYLLIPLAPTPTARQPLPMDPVTNGRPNVDRGPALLPSMAHLGAFHASHSIHSLRVSSLFMRLDQANVWERGVKCSAYSQGVRGLSPFDDEILADQGGVCTVLKVEFEGWSSAEVRAVIGESGTGWCVLEEVGHTYLSPGDGEESETDSLASAAFGDDPYMGCFQSNGSGVIDPAQSLVLPTLDFSAAFISAGSGVSVCSNDRDGCADIPPDMQTDPWLDDCQISNSISFSDLSATDFGVQSLYSGGE